MKEVENAITMDDLVLPVRAVVEISMTSSQLTLMKHPVKIVSTGFYFFGQGVCNGAGGGAGPEEAVVV